MYYRIIYLLVAINSFLVPFLSANILRVPENYLSIQAAINVAVNGDTVLVAPGIYYENVNFRGKGICLTSHYILSRDTSYISGTVINGSTPVHPDTGSCVLMIQPDISTGGDASASLIGFTLTGGSGSIQPSLATSTDFSQSRKTTLGTANR